MPILKFEQKLLIASSLEEIIEVSTGCFSTSAKDSQVICIDKRVTGLLHLLYGFIQEKLHKTSTGLSDHAAVAVNSLVSET